LRHLEARGFDGAPRSLGFDDDGRHVVEWIEGDHPIVTDANAEAICGRVGEIIRDFHEAVADFQPSAGTPWNIVIEPDHEELVIHHDLAPWNLICGADRWVFIDWDNTGPGSRLWDLSYAAHGFVPLASGVDPEQAGRRLALLADGYELDREGRQRLGQLLVRRIRSMYDLLERGHRSGEQPWSRLWDEGHGEAWAADVTFTETHLDTITRAMVEG